MYGVSVRSKDWGFPLAAGQFDSLADAVAYATNHCRGKAGGSTEGSVWRNGADYATLLAWS